MKQHWIMTMTQDIVGESFTVRATMRNAGLSLGSSGLERMIYWCTSEISLNTGTGTIGTWQYIQTTDQT